MEQSVRTVHLQRAFWEGQRTITIKYARTAYKCACGVPDHRITPGEICAYVVDYRSSERRYWHHDHLQDHWKLIVLDSNEQEIARFGC